MDKETFSKLLGVNPSDTLTYKEVAHNRYRVNIYTQTYIDGSVVPRTTMQKSYYLEYDKENNSIKDLTI
jgi:hypothetical protein